MLITEYLDRSLSPYHAVATGMAMLEERGFRPLNEADKWSLKSGGRYYVTRGGRSIVAWSMGSKAAETTGFRIVAAHTDSPVLKIKPNAPVAGTEGSWLSTQIYGSPILHTWLDRDLKIVGAVHALDDKGALVRHLIDLDDLRVRLVSLAPHLRQGGADEFRIDRIQDLVVQLGGKDAWPRLVAEAIGVEPSRIKGMDLNLCDAQPAGFTGADREFVSGARLDNLASCFAGLEALCADEGASGATSVLSLYDAEEIGSTTWNGAKSNFLQAILARIVGGETEAYYRACAGSILVSADMAHGVHPSYPSAMDANNAPTLNGGLAVKSSAAANYLDCVEAEAWFRAACDEAGVRLQSFMYRVGHRGGSALGPFASTVLGIQGVDVGAPMLGMHSIREVMGRSDIEKSVAAFSAFFASRMSMGSTR